MSCASLPLFPVSLSSTGPNGFKCCTIQLTGVTALDSIKQHPFQVLLCLPKCPVGKTGLFLPRNASFIEPLL